MKIGLRGAVVAFRWLAVSTIAACLIGVAASAATLTFEANLDGLQEVPPNASPAFGMGELTLDTVSGFVTITTGTYQDLLGGATAVTINDAAIGANGPIILTVTLDTPGAATGTFSGSGTLTAGQVTDMIDTNTYINIRSQVYPSGEIRGQLFLVPEPSSVLLACIGLAALFVVRRRKE